MLIARILTAVVLLAVLIPVVFVGPVWAWGIVSLALLMVACVEWIALLPPDRLGARDRIAVLAALNLAFEQTEVSPSTSTQVATTETSATLSDSDQDRLGQLLKKLDQALHQDGQLI